MMPLAPMGWAGRTWALPFLAVLCPSERCHQQKAKRHKKLTDRARQMALQLSRWLQGLKVAIVGDTTYSRIELLASTRRFVTWVTRSRMDAALHDPAPERLALSLDQLFKKQNLTTFSTARYQKPNPTFSDALASVRYRIWRYQHFCTSVSNPVSQKTHPAFIEHLCFMAARAA